NIFPDTKRGFGVLPNKDTAGSIPAIMKVERSAVQYLEDSGHCRDHCNPDHQRADHPIPFSYHTLPSKRLSVWIILTLRLMVEKVAGIGVRLKIPPERTSEFTDTRRADTQVCPSSARISESSDTRYAAMVRVHTDEAVVFASA